jgi:glycosyltransferase involved in cell wall biosynthesis
MRILFVSNLYPPNVMGGYERLCGDVAAAMVARGHAVTVLTSSHGGAVADYPGQTVHRTLRLLTGENIYQPFPGDAAARDAVNRANIAAAGQLVAAVRPDAIFSWNLFFLDNSLLDSLAGSGVPLLAMLTDNWLLNMRVPERLARYFTDHVFGDLPFPPVPAARPGVLRRVLRRLGLAPAATVLPVERLPYAAVFGSRFVRTLYHAAGIGFAREEVIHNGVRPAPGAGSSGPDRSGTVAPGELRLLVAGRLVELKGVHLAIAALPLLNTMGLGRVRLAIVGDRREEAYCQRLVAETAAHGVAAQVAFHEPVAEDRLVELFSQHDIYVFPSLYEPFALTLIHALAAGIPTVASDAGGTVEIVRDRETGLLFHKGDVAGLARAVAALATDPALRVRVAQRGRRVAAGFTFDAMAGRMEQVLRSLA